MKIFKIQFHDFHQLISTKRLNILSLLQKERERERFAAPAARKGNEFDSLISTFPHLSSL